MTSDDATSAEATVEVKVRDLKLLIELGCSARSLAWSVKNYRGELKDGIEVGMSISDVLSQEHALNVILGEYPNMHPYD